MIFGGVPLYPITVDSHYAMAAETPTHHEQATEPVTAEGYLSPTADFVVIFMIALAVALLGVAILHP